jgi:hypothetical protein
MYQRTFELFYEKFVPGQIFGVQRLKRGDKRDPSLRVIRNNARGFTGDLPAQRSQRALLRRAPPEEAT